MSNLLNFKDIRNINKSIDKIINIKFDQLDNLYDAIELGLQYNIMNYQIDFYNESQLNKNKIIQLLIQVAGLLDIKYNENIILSLNYNENLFFKDANQANYYVEKLNELCYHHDYSIRFDSNIEYNNQLEELNELNTINKNEISDENQSEEFDIIFDSSLDEDMKFIQSDIIPINSNQKYSKYYDVAVIGAGLYGRYIANKLCKQNLNVIIIAEDDCSKFKQSKSGSASLVNQARIHNGYHYPRSITTAKYSVDFYQKFIDDFHSAVIDNFQKIYAIPKYGSQTTAKQFEKFCSDLNIKCEKYMPSILNKKQLQGSWLCEEKAIDTIEMMKIMIERTKHIPFVHQKVIRLEKENDIWSIDCENEFIQSKLIVNATYAGINDLEKLAQLNLTPVKFEACEIAIFEAPKSLNQLSFTFMDGPFASLMPHNKDGLWSLTSVLYTPHYSSYESIQADVRNMESNFECMKQQLKLYLNESIVDEFKYIKSEYVIKTISSNAENDDNRFVQINWQDNNFVSILSGKLNAIYELDDLILDIKEKVSIND